MGFPGGSDGKDAGDLGSIPGLGRSPEKGMAIHPLQYSCLENLRDGGGWRATAQGRKESNTAE